MRNITVAVDDETRTFLIVAAIGMFVSACAPAADRPTAAADDQEKTQILSLPGGMTNWEATVNGMPITYRAVDQITGANGVPSEAGIAGTPKNASGSVAVPEFSPLGGR